MISAGQCLCGGHPKFVEVCRGHREAVLLNCGSPDAFKVVCTRCGYETKEHSYGDNAVKEWNEHAKGGAK